MTKHEGKLGLVLSGGGARGAFEAGVLYRLESDARFADPRVIAGTSAGAINAALVAAGKPVSSIRDFWLDFAAVKPAESNDAFFAELLVQLTKIALDQPLRTLREVLRALPTHRGLGLLPSLLFEVALTRRFDLVHRLLAGVRATSLAIVDRLRAHLIDCFGGERIVTPRCALAINAVDARTNCAVHFVNRRSERVRGPGFVSVDHITVDMVLASISIPILFPSIALDDRILWDGGVLNNTPIAPAVALGADRVVTVLVSSHHDIGGFANLGEALTRVTDMLLENAYNVDERLLLAKNRIAELEHQLEVGDRRFKKVQLYEPVRPMRDEAFAVGSLLDFDRERVTHLYQHGLAAGSAWLRAGPRILDTNSPARSAPRAAAE